MKKRKPGIFIWIILSEIALLLFSNLLFCRFRDTGENRFYRVEVSRIADSLRAGEQPDLTACEYVKAVTPFDDAVTSVEDYAVARGKDGTLYRITYERGQDNSRSKQWILINGIWGAVLLFTLLAALYVHRKLLVPFRDIADLPRELSKGNLSVPIREEKSRYFGEFLWGMDLLREHMEQEKNERLALEREKKTMILTLSHDIKTPISAIKLYNKALSSGLYDTEEKKNEAYAGIEKNANELEKYMEDIRRTVREDAMIFRVENKTWYLSNVVDDLTKLYREKTAGNKTVFTVAPFEDCLLAGDPDRALEVLQNLMENAMKYGDGKEIGITFSDEEDCRLITVYNTGNTLPETERTSIFDSFYRGSNTDGIKGSGLGLYICRSLMRAMDGEIFAGTEDDRFMITAVFKKA